MSKTLLCVDDSVTMRSVLEMTFQSDGYSVLSANGAKASEAFLSHQLSGAIIDTSLEGEDPYALAMEIRKRFPKSAILMLPSASAPYEPNRGAAAGVDDFCVKPFDTQDLLDKCKKALEAREGKKVTNLALGAAAKVPSLPRWSEPDKSASLAEDPEIFVEEEVEVAPRPTSGQTTPPPALREVASPPSRRFPPTPDAKAGGPPPPPPPSSRPAIPSSHTLVSSTSGLSKPNLSPSPPANAPPVYAPKPFARPSTAPNVRRSVPPSPPQPQPSSMSAFHSRTTHTSAGPSMPVKPSLPKPFTSTQNLKQPENLVVDRPSVDKITLPTSDQLKDLGLTSAQNEAVLSLTRDVVERVVRQIVPTLAETIIKEEIARLLEAEDERQ